MLRAGYWGRGMMIKSIIKGDLVFQPSWGRSTGHCLPYGITQCYLPPDTGEHALPNPSQKG